MIAKAMRDLGISDAQPRGQGRRHARPICEEGTAAGCGLVIGVTAGSHTAEQLEAVPHTHLVGTVAERAGAVGDLMRIRQAELRLRCRTDPAAGYRGWITCSSFGR